MNLVKRTGQTLIACGLLTAVAVGMFPCNALASTAVSSNNNGMESVQRARSLYGKTIVVDAGHGGQDSGARGVHGVHEKDITLAVALRLTEYLHEAGAHVVMTRSTDTDLATDSDRAMRRRHLGDLKGRLNVVRAQSVDAFVSVHCNGAPSPSWHGATVLYLHENDHGKELANLMQASFRENLLPTKRGIEANKTLYLLKRVKGPTVLAEIGFITNPEEASHLQQASYQGKVAFAMYKALVQYFDTVPGNDAQPGNGAQEQDTE